MNDIASASTTGFLPPNTEDMMLNVAKSTHTAMKAVRRSPNFDAATAIASKNEHSNKELNSAVPD
jgi:hypothetical protein